MLNLGVSLSQDAHHYQVNIVELAVGQLLFGTVITHGKAFTAIFQPPWVSKTHLSPQSISFMHQS